MTEPWTGHDTFATLALVVDCIALAVAVRSLVGARQAFRLLSDAERSSARRDAARIAAGDRGHEVVGGFEGPCSATQCGGTLLFADFEGKSDAQRQEINVVTAGETAPDFPGSAP